MIGNKARASTAGSRIAPAVPWVLTAHSWVYTVFKIMGNDACYHTDSNTQKPDALLFIKRALGQILRAGGAKRSSGLGDLQYVAEQTYTHVSPELSNASVGTHRVN